jgi:hypothetical protein
MHGVPSTGHIVKCEFGDRDRVICRSSVALFDFMMYPSPQNTKVSASIISIDRRVTKILTVFRAVEDCAGENVRLYDGWRAADAAGGANYRTLVPCSPHERPYYLPMYLPTCVPTYLPAYLPTCVGA